MYWSFPVLIILIGASSAILFDGNLTQFYGNGTVYCNLPNQWWCFKVTLYETDYPLTDDRIDFFGSRCTRKPSYDYKLSGKQYGDGIFWNTFYELTLFINHNCTNTGAKIRQIERITQYAPTSASYVEIKPWNSSITNLGQESAAYL